MRARGTGKKAAAKMRGGVSWAGRVAVMERYTGSAFRRMGNQGLLTSAHNLGHVSRVATYASAYVEALGGGRKRQAMAKIVGLGHDRFRDPVDSLTKKGEKVEHPEQAATFFKPIFERRYTKKVAKQMIDAMAKHDSFPALNQVGKNLVRDALVYADKFFEANGAYIAFRRSMFMGERKDWRAEAVKRGVAENPAELKKLAVEATLAETEKRVKKFSNLDDIPQHMHSFVKYQVQWQHRLADALRAGDPGMTHLVTALFAEGLRAKPRDLGALITTYQPIAESDAAFKHEAMRYLNGDLAQTFKQLVRKPAA